jgi:pimeloyl-ACP methyl ester carboxylesterase
MGGYVALALAELYPEKVRALVLQNSTSKADSEERSNPIKLLNLPDSVSAIASFLAMTE